MGHLAANVTMMFTEVPLAERLPLAAQAGFSAIECLWPYEIEARQFKTLLAQNGLTLALINTATGAGGSHFGLTADPERRAEFRGLVEKALAYVAIAGAKRIHVMAGEFPQHPRNRDAMIANLKDVSRFAGDAGVTLVIEPINARDRPNWFLRSTAQALDILGEVGSPAVRLLFDVYHVQIIEGDLTRRIEACMPHIGHVQIAGVPERHEPDRSEINIAHVLGVFDRLGYDGFIGCEYRPAAGTLAGLGWAAPFGVTPSKTT